MVAPARRAALVRQGCRSHYAASVAQEAALASSPAKGARDIHQETDTEISI